jgi:hypothetical protein
VGPYKVRGIVLKPRCSAFQYMYIKSFLYPNNHVRVTIIPFLMFYLTTLPFAKLHMASLPDEGHARVGHRWNHTGREEPSELKGKKSVPATQFHSLFFLRTCQWIQPVKTDEVAVFNTHRLFSPYRNEWRQTKNIVTTICTLRHLHKLYIFLTRGVSACFVRFSNNKLTFSRIALTHWSF